MVYKYYLATKAAVFCSYSELFADEFKPRIIIIIALYMEYMEKKHVETPIGEIGARILPTVRFLLT